MATQNWAEIEQTEEYQRDYELLLTVFVNSLGNEAIFDKTNALVQLFAHLLAIHRYFTIHFPEMKDLDETLFVEDMKKEIGYNLPALTAFPTIQLLKESKHWFGHKGVEVLYHFLGSLINSPVELTYPQKLIFHLDTLDHALDGDVSNNGPKRFAESKLAHIRDGIFWAKFTYVVNILQGQLVSNWTDMDLILKSIHPSGLQMFLHVLNWNYLDRPEEWIDFAGQFQKHRDYFYAFRRYRGLSNGFILDSTDSLLDQLYSHAWVGTTYIRETPSAQSFNYAYRTIAHNGFMHSHPVGYPGECFFKWAPTTDDQYKQVYADQDGEILTIQQTNMSLKDIPYGELKNRSFREFKNIAWNKRGQNPSKNWDRDVPLCTIVES